MTGSGGFVCFVRSFYGFWPDVRKFQFQASLTIRFPVLTRIDLLPSILSVAKVRLLFQRAASLQLFFRSKEKIVSGVHQGFRFKFRETYIHIRSKLNLSRDSGTFD